MSRPNSHKRPILPCVIKRKNRNSSKLAHDTDYLSKGDILESIDQPGCGSGTGILRRYTIVQYKYLWLISMKFGS